MCNWAKQWDTAMFDVLLRAWVRWPAAGWTDKRLKFPQTRRSTTWRRPRRLTRTGEMPTRSNANRLDVLQGREPQFETLQRASRARRRPRWYRMNPWVHFTHVYGATADRNMGHVYWVSGITTCEQRLETSSHPPPAWRHLHEDQSHQSWSSLGSNRADTSLTKLRPLASVKGFCLTGAGSGFRRSKYSSKLWCYSIFLDCV